MTTIEYVWRQERSLAATKPVDREGLRLTRIDTESRFDAYAGIDDAGNGVLAVGVPARPPAIALRSSALDYFRRQRADSSWLMVLRLKIIGLEPVFGRLCQDLVDAANAVATHDELVALLVARLRLWEKLFISRENGLLELHEMRGLAAELLVLEYIVMTGVRGSVAAVEGWIGPTGADQDFVYADMALEVKAVAPNRDCVTISSLDQLSLPGALFLIVVILEHVTKGAVGAVTLNELVSRLEGRFASQPVALSCFKDRLLEARYVEHAYYDEHWFRPSDTRAFGVRDGFPRLTAASVPAGVVSATYELDLASLTAFELSGLPG